MWNLSVGEGLIGLIGIHGIMQNFSKYGRKCWKWSNFFHKRFFNIWKFKYLFDLVVIIMRLEFYFCYEESIFVKWIELYLEFCMFDKSSILIEFYKLGDDYGQFFLHYLFYDHFIWGNIQKKKVKKKKKKIFTCKVYSNDS